MHTPSGFSCLVQLLDYQNSVKRIIHFINEMDQIIREQKLNDGKTELPSAANYL
jgi:hypothetical protein